MIESKKDEDKTPAIGVLSIPISTAMDCMSPEKLARLGISLLKTIAKITSRDVIHPLIKDFPDEVDPSIIEEVLWRDNSLGENSFWDLVTQLHHVRECGGIEVLKADGHSFEDRETESSFLSRMMEAHPNKISDLYLNLREKSGQDIAGKTFHLFKCSVPDTQVAPLLENVTPEKILEALGNHFKRKGYGDFRQVIPSRAGQSWGFLVNRGTTRVTNAVVDREEQKRFRDDRRVKTDAVFYLAETNTLWVQCQFAGDAAMYATAIGEILGNKDMFKRRQNYDLSLFLNKNAGSDLLRAANQMQFFRIEIRHINVLVAGATISQPARRGPCLTERYSEFSQVHPANEMKMVKLRAILSADGKNYVDITLREDSLQTGLDPMKTSELMGILKIWNLYGH